MYDTAGNLTRWQREGGVVTEYGYYPSHQLRLRREGGQDRTLYAYTAGSERIAQYDMVQDVIVVTLRGLDAKVLRVVEFRNGTSWHWMKDYVYANGRHLGAVSAAEGERHCSLDHLGSIRLITNPQRTMVGYHAYYPFGEEAETTWDGEVMKFTGHERDLHGTTAAMDDLDHMHARSYNPNLARFLTIDPGRDNDPSQPQSWNLYAYTRGNPMKYVDPTGKVTLVFTVGPGQGLSERFGHSAAFFSTPGVPGRGISLGGNHTFEAGLFNFVESYVSEGRDILLSFLATTPTQDARSISFLEDNPGGAVNRDAFLATPMIRENCAQAVGNALEAGGIFPAGSNSSQIPGGVASLPHLLLLRVMTHPQHIETIRIPSGTNMEKLKEFLGIIIRSVGNEADAR